MRRPDREPRGFTVEVVGRRGSNRARTVAPVIPAKRTFNTNPRNEQLIDPPADDLPEVNVREDIEEPSTHSVDSVFSRFSPMALDAPQPDVDPSAFFKPYDDGETAEESQPVPQQAAEPEKPPQPEPPKEEQRKPRILPNLLTPDPIQKRLEERLKQAEIASRRGRKPKVKATETEKAQEPWPDDTQIEARKAPESEPPKQLDIEDAIRETAPEAPPSVEFKQPEKKLRQKVQRMKPVAEPKEKPEPTKTVSLAKVSFLEDPAPPAPPPVIAQPGSHARSLYATRGFQRTRRSEEPEFFKPGERWKRRIPAVIR